jgi:membrane protein
MKIVNIFSPLIIFCKALWADIGQKRIIGTASNLTYSMLLAFVPILAVVFAIARGFGYSIYIEEWFKDSLASQPEAAETIIGFVNSYLKHTQKGAFLGIGLIFMLWTTLMLISNIESAFNDIWQVKRQRSIFRTITDYVALLFLIPIVIVISSGLSLLTAALNHQLKDIVVIGPLMSISIKLSPYLLLSVAFIALYVFMPNTKVKLKSAIIPGIIAGVSMQIFQSIYINSQIWISNYNAIYGSFAIIPFFLLWLQTSWIICLVGAELSYTRQNSEDFISTTTTEPSFASRCEASWRILQLINHRFRNGEKALTAEEIKQSLKISMRHINTLLYDLEQINLIAEITHDEKGDTARYLPAEALDNVTKEVLFEKLANLGNPLTLS